MAKLTEFKNPLSGDKGNILSPADWIQNILGVMFFLVVIATGQKLIGAVEKKAPMIDGTPNQLFTPVQTVQQGNQMTII